MSYSKSTQVGVVLPTVAASLAGLTLGCFNPDSTDSTSSVTVNGAHEKVLDSNELEELVGPSLSLDVVGEKLCYGAGEEHPFSSVFAETISRSPLATPKELASMQAQILCEKGKEFGSVWRAHYLRSLESVYPKNCNFDLLKVHLEAFKNQFSKEFSESTLAGQILESRISGQVAFRPEIVDDRTQIRLNYNVRPWEHPEQAYYYKLTLSVKACVITNDEHGSIVKEEVVVDTTKSVPIIPDSNIRWSYDELFNIPMLSDGQIVETTLSMSYLSCTDRNDFNKGYTQAPITNVTRYEYVEGDKALVLIDGEYALSDSALVDGLNEVGAMLDWHQKLENSSYQKNLEDRILGQTIEISLKERSRISVPWVPATAGSQFQKPTLIEFGTMTCGPCLKALPVLAGISKKEKDFDVIALFHHKNAVGVEKLTDTPMLAVNDKAFNEEYGISTYPTSLLVDKSGVVRWVGHGTMKPSYLLIQELIEEQR